MDLSDHSGQRHRCYNCTPRQVTDSDGNRYYGSADAATNYAAPQTITTATYGENVAYTPYLAPSQVTGLNGEQMTPYVQLWETGDRDERLWGLNAFHLLGHAGSSFLAIESGAGRVYEDDA